MPAGTYQVFFEVPPELDYVVPPIWTIVVSTDTAPYPAVSAVAAGHIAGTVYRPDGVTPAEDFPVVASLADTFEWVSIDSTCFDGTYDLRAPAGSYTVEVNASWEDHCLADEYYDGTHYSCEATAVGVTTGGHDRRDRHHAGSGGQRLGPRARQLGLGHRICSGMYRRRACFSTLQTALHRYERRRQLHAVFDTRGQRLPCLDRCWRLSDRVLERPADLRDLRPRDGRRVHDHTRNRRCVG